LGVAYESIKSYQDAIGMFEEYLELAPEGEYAEASSAYVKQLNDEYSEQFITADELDRQVVALAEKLKADPGNALDQYELANLLWLRGDYDEAAKLYLALVQIHPEYAADSLVMRRIEILPTGEYIVLTPAEVQRREIEAEPVKVFNISAFRSGPDLITRMPRFYVVTGQVVNRSDSVLYGVSVNTTLFGFGNTVYDTNRVSLGRMNPGEIRAFSMRFSNFENIENIYRHECVATFER
jgi:tetratricopeptide (TPR) repeat protein